jgi:hypothetical protein
MTMAWNITLKCAHRYQLADPPDLSRPLICGFRQKNGPESCGLQMIVQATEAVYAEVLAHNARAAERRSTEDRARRRRALAAQAIEGTPDLAADLKASLEAHRGIH